MTVSFAPIAVIFAIALVVTLVMTPVASKIAWKLDAVDYPSKRRVNIKPIPRMGGIAVASGLTIACCAWLLLQNVDGWDPMGGVSPDPSINFIGIGLAIIGMFLVGAVDDVKNLMPTTKFLWQIIAACAVAAFGLVIGDIVNPFDESVIHLGIWTYPITVFYLVSFANVVNLIDGLDGLASGVSAFAGIGLMVVAAMAGHMEAVAFAAALVGATLGFLRWNFNPAKIFLGDSGSLTLGFTIGVISLVGNTHTTAITMLLVPGIVVTMPIMDTVAAMIRRTRVGISIGQADKGHIHHRLLARGFGQRAAVAIMYCWTIISCLCAVGVTQVGVFARVVIFTALVTGSFLACMLLNCFVPVLRKRFDPETGENEVVPIDEVDKEDDYTVEEISEIISGGMGVQENAEESVVKTKRPLKILAVSQHYWPEPFAIPDVCEGLAARGHDVTVLTGTPNYPDGDIYAGYEKGAQAVQERNGVHIKRVNLIPRGREIWTRVLNYYSFTINAKRAARSMEPGFDVVLSFQTSPVMMSEAAIEYAKKNNVPVLLWCQDLWPVSLTVGNIKRSSMAYRYYKKVSRGIYSAADVLAISSRNFGDYYKEELGMTNVETTYLPQYAEDIFNGEAEQREEFASDKLNLTFAGNVGTAQAVNTLVEAGHYLSDDERFALHVVGSGSELETLKKYKNEIGADCVEFHGRYPLSDMPSFYNSSDAMVATFKDNAIFGYTLPRKITSYMAAGRPILGTVTGEARAIIEEAGCGLCCDPEDPKALAEICKQFADLTPEEREAMGRNGRRYYEEHFAKERFYETLESELQRVKGTGHHAG